jgi:hypothetical protein
MAEVSGANNWFGDSSATVSISARKGILQEIHTHPKTPFFFLPFLMKSTYKGRGQKTFQNFKKIIPRCSQWSANVQNLNTNYYIF